METNLHWAVQFAGMKQQTRKISEKLLLVSMFVI